MHIVHVGMEYDVLRENNRIANSNYRLLKEKGVRAIEFMGSIGSGKTSLIIKLAERARGKGLRAFAIAGDVTGDDDQRRMRESGLEAVNCNTGRECHLDASLVRKSLEAVDLDGYDLVFIENVGNLVCPADFPLGAEYRVVVISTTEGDDMVRKHHDIFLHSDIAILNKMDVAGAVGVDPGVIADDYGRLTGGLKAMYMCSTRTEEGIDEILSALEL
ncbi:MAG: hydrogenase nickel incorporation protein HypB [Methanomassiliicoccaceae archaeon]|nr:hydrogenase nickel incorporation protein HypB [Methanomassiliicoccaceae archaeon]